MAECVIKIDVKCFQPFSLLTYVDSSHKVQKYAAPPLSTTLYTVYNLCILYCIPLYSVYTLSNLLNVSATCNQRLAFELILTTTLYSSILADFLQSESHLFL